MCINEPRKYEAVRTVYDDIIRPRGLQRNVYLKESIAVDGGATVGNDFRVIGIGQNETVHEDKLRTGGGNSHKAITGGS